MSNEKPNKKQIEDLLGEDMKDVKFYSPEGYGRAKKALVTLSGLALTQDGKLTKHDWFDFLDVKLDNYDDIILSADDARRLQHYFKKLSTGTVSTIPMYCGGEKHCPQADFCEFVKLGKIPLGRRCLVEVELVDFWTKRYLEEYDVDVNDQTDVYMIGELAELNVLEMRINNILAKFENSELSEVTIAGQDQDGRPIETVKISRFWEIKESIKNRRLKILEALVGTRKDKYKRDAALKRMDSSDGKTSLAELKRTIDEYLKQQEIVIDQAEDITRK